jgi:hypothetical protein
MATVLDVARYILEKTGVISTVKLQKLVCVQPRMADDLDGEAPLP